MCQPGTRPQEILVRIFEGETITLRLGNLAAMIAYGQSLPTCSGNRPPTCSVTVTGSPLVENGITTAKIDATSSFDPDSAQPLKYKFAPLCRNISGAIPNPNFTFVAGVDDIVNAKRELTIDNPTSGPGIVCDINLTVTDVQGASASCTTNFPVTPVIIDCKGVVNGPAKIDSCGICGGNDSCVGTECKSIDLNPSAAALDGGVATQRGIVFNLTPRFYRWAKDNTAARRKAADFRSRAQTAYLKNWTLAYTPVGLTCAKAANCSLKSLGSALTEYVRGSELFLGIHKELISALRPIAKATVDRRLRGKRMKELDDALAQAIATHNANLKLVKDTPSNTGACS